jgi:hypothetical protein
MLDAAAFMNAAPAVGTTTGGAEAATAMAPLAFISPVYGARLQPQGHVQQGLHDARAGIVGASSLGSPLPLSAVPAAVPVTWLLAGGAVQGPGGGAVDQLDAAVAPDAALLAPLLEGTARSPGRQV